MSVVAEEMRRKAGNNAQSLKDIPTILNQLKEKASKIQMVINNLSPISERQAAALRMKFQHLWKK